MRKNVKTEDNGVVSYYIDKGNRTSKVKHQRVIHTPMERTVQEEKIAEELCRAFTHKEE